MRQWVAICATLTESALLTCAAQAGAANSDANVVNGQSLTETTRRNGPAEQFGAKGQLAISGDAAPAIANTSISGVNGSTTNIELSPAIDYFFIKNWSVGAFLGFNYTATSTSHSTRFGIGPRVGYNFTLSDLVSIWPKAGLSLSSTSTTTDAPSAMLPGVTTTSTASGTNIALNLFVPLVFHPAPHFFVGFGPFLDTDLNGDVKATTLGGKLTLGGWI